MKTIKLIAITIILFITVNETKAQYGFGTNTPNPNSVGHFYATDSAKGLVIPTVTTAKRPVATSSLNGMLVYNITDSCMQFCNGIKWLCLDSIGGVLEWEKGSLHGDGDTVIYAVRAKSDSSKNVRVYSNGNFDLDGHYMKDGITILTNQPNNVGANNYNLAIGYRALNNVSSVAQYNVAIGYEALQNDSLGDYNTANGYRALFSNKSGGYNTASGSNALYSNTTGNYNVANGRFSLYNNTTGSYNIANGAHALYLNTTGNYNVANGHQALERNTTGSYNAANGYRALYFNTTGSNNVATGQNALRANTTGDNNVASGSQALRSNTTGNSNIAVGPLALYSNTSGNNNIATGVSALQINTTGSYNIAIGYQSLHINTTGSYNAANGYRALQNNLTGINNIASGREAMRNNTSGNYNVASGYRALLNNSIGANNVAIGNSALHDNSTTSNNTALGYHAFYGFTNDLGNIMNFNPGDINITTENIYFPTHGFTIGTTYRFRLNTTGTAPGGAGNNAIYYFTPTHVDSIQYNGNFTSQGTGVHTLTPNVTRDINNATVLGANAQPTKSNQVTLGATTVTEVRTYGSLIPGTDGVPSIGSATERWNTVYATNGTINTSDKRMKTNINTLNYGLNEVMKLKAVTYNWKENNNGTRLGFIAQDLQKLLPEVVNEANNDEKTLGVRYTELIPVLTKAIQEQQIIIQQQEGVAMDQQLIIEDQQQRLEKLEKLVEQLLEDK